jgi:hypothetical protein
MIERIAEASPGFKARMAGVFYLLTFLTGGAALFVRGRLGLVNRPYRGRLLYRCDTALLLHI